MTAEKSANRITNNFWVNWKQKTWSNRRIMIVLFVLHMLAAPANLLNVLIYTGLEKRYNQGLIAYCPDFNEFYPVIGIFTTGLAVAAGILVAIVVFQYLYKKSKVDMYYSLPLTTNQRFFSDFLAGISVYLLPFLAAQVFSIILCVIGQICFPKEFSFEYIIGDGYRSGHVNSLLGFLMLLIFAGIVLMLLVYTFTVITMACCGSQFEVISYTALINVMVPLTPAVFAGILFGNLYGIETWSEALPLIERTSPIGGAIGLFEWIGSGLMLSEYFWLVIPMLLFAAAIAALSLFLYRKRKAEQVGRPFVFKIFYYLLLTSITFCIVCAFIGGSYDPDRLIPMFIVTAIWYLIPEIITNRGVKKFYKSLIHYGITMAAVIAMVFVSQISDGFGIVHYVPSSLTVRSADIDVGAKFLEYGINCTFKEEENIERVREIQKDILKNNPDGVDWRYESEVWNVGIYYKTMMGATVIRNYSNPKISESAKQMILALQSSDENINATIDEIKRPYINSFYIRDKYDNGYEEVICSRDARGGRIKVKNDEEFYALRDELAEALRKDLLARGKNEFKPSVYDTVFILGFNGYDFAVTETDRNVLAWFEKHMIVSDNF